MYAYLWLRTAYLVRLDADRGRSASIYTSRTGRSLTACAASLRGLGDGEREHTESLGVLEALRRPIPPGSRFLAERHGLS